MVNIMKQRALLLFVIVSVLLSGCGNDPKTPQQTADNASTYTHSSIPFLVQKPVSATDAKIEVLRGNWDLDRGTVQIEIEPIFEVNGSSPNYHLKWDGGDRISFVTEPSPPVELKITNNRYEVDVYKSEHYGGVLLQCPSWDDKAIIYESGPEGPYLDFRSVGNSDKIHDKIYAAIPAGKVQLMTVHAAKGLEFPYVFVVNVTGGHMPHVKASDIEEERRIFYVALTKARKGFL